MFSTRESKSGRGVSADGAVVRGRAEELSRRLDAMPGVAAAVPDRVFYVQALVDGRPPPVEGQRQDTYQGHGWSSARLGGLALVAGAPPRGPVKWWSIGTRASAGRVR
ncbi:hypothetical protein GCM10020218_091890 [Dactylosporangium vinaceum]